MKVLLVFFIFAFVGKCLAGPTNSTNSTCIEDKYKYPCSHRFYRYNLDNDPADYGVAAGQYEPGKEIYIGLTIYHGVSYQLVHLQLSPPGIRVFNSAGPSYFFNDSSKIWYLVNDPHHEYTWVDSWANYVPPFAIVIGLEETGFALLPARIKKGNNLFDVGTEAPALGGIYYTDDNFMNRWSNDSYQVLTCRSSVENETRYLPPPIDAIPNEDLPPNCINNWQPYLNDDAPNRNGVAAGEYDCNNTAYVGKTKIDLIVNPGRIQTVSETGFYGTSDGLPFYASNGSYYLVDNPSYTYRWIPFNGSSSLPYNLVYSRNVVGYWKYPIGRIKQNGKTQIGKVVAPIFYALDDHGVEIHLKNYELLVCDPWPKYHCFQQWEKFNVSNITTGPANDGFEVGTLNGNISVYIGRCCDVNLGRAQVAPAAGVYYLDDITEKVAFDNFTAEYLVKNSSYYYKWVSSRNGVKVKNALGLHREGHQSYYIGATHINGNTFVGRVLPGEGLVYADKNGARASINSYEVLTCTSSNPENGIFAEESDENWYGGFWCPPKTKWSYELEKCV